MNLRIPLSLLAALLMMVLGSTAHAESQPFGTAGQMSPYGQFSLRHSQGYQNFAGYQTGLSTTQMRAWGGIDYFQRDNFSIGGGAGLVIRSDDFQSPQISTSTVCSGLGPRIGWNLSLSDGLSLYSRLGTFVVFSYSDSSSYMTVGLYGSPWAGTPGSWDITWTSQLSVDLRIALKNGLYLDIGPTVRQELMSYRPSSPGTTQASEHIREYDFFFTVGLAWVLEN